VRFCSRYPSPPLASEAIAAVATNLGTIAVSAAEAGSDTRRERTFETTPGGNSVVLEDEMTKVATQRSIRSPPCSRPSLNLLKPGVKGGLTHGS
jgi:hypothetical protein